MNADSTRSRLHLNFAMGRVNYVNGGILPPQSVGQGACAGRTSAASPRGPRRVFS